jgi:hypothetical protein
MAVTASNATWQQQLPKQLPSRLWRQLFLQCLVYVIVWHTFQHVSLFEDSFGNYSSAATAMKYLSLNQAKKTSKEVANLTSGNIFTENPSDLLQTINLYYYMII